jgi:hypothetical protein
MHVLPGASLIARIAFEKAGGFDERLSGYEDDDLFMSIFSAGYDNVFIPRPLSQWRMVQGSSGHSHRMLASGRIYMRKLLQSFPDDETCGHYYARDVIAPRFMQSAFVRYGSAVRERRSERIMDICDALNEILPHLNWRKRAALRLALPLMRSRLAGQALFAVRPVLQRVYRAVFA